MAQNFGEAFAETIPAGIALSQNMESQRKTRAARKAGEIMAEIQAWQPTDTSQQGIPEDGSAPTNPNQAPSGKGLSDLTNRYFAAIGDLGDVRDYAGAMQTYGKYKMDRINEYLGAAISDWDSGDHEGAARGLRMAQAFQPDTGGPTEISVDPKSNAALIVNHDKAGNPVGGGALTRENLIEMMGLNTDPMTWAAQDMSDRHFKQQMALSYQKFNAAQGRANAAAAAASDKAKTQAQKDQLLIQKTGLEIEKLQMENAKTGATIDSDVLKQLAQNANDTDAALDAPGERDDAAFDKELAEVDKHLEDLTSYPTTGSVPVPPGQASPSPGGIPDQGDLSDDQGLMSGDIVVAPTAKGGEKKALDTWWYDISPDGVGLKNGPMFSMKNEIVKDVMDTDLNGDYGRELPPESKAALVEGLIGRSGKAQMYEKPTGPNGEMEGYAGDGVIETRLGDDTYGDVFTFRQNTGLQRQELMGETQGPNPDYSQPNPSVIPGAAPGAAPEAPAAVQGPAGMPFNGDVPLSGIPQPPPVRPGYGVDDTAARAF